ncbi:MAG: nitroreductase family protein [Methanoregulaceae archaeon]|nr:nitroreductase family protein [Methanoregulaceae archaeon]
MDPVTIDTSLCSGCGICMILCPHSIPVLNEETEKAAINPIAAPYCSRCGHCESACPEGAIAVMYPGAGPVPVISGQPVTTGQLGQLMMMRRSIRDFHEKTVPQETLQEIFDIIRYAPTGMNSQSVHWLVIGDPEEVRRLSGGVIDWARDLLKAQPGHPLAPVFPLLIGAWERGRDPICHGAPHLIIAHGRRDNPVGFIDAVIAMTHLDLAAPVFGLGTCWAGFMQIALDSSPDLEKELKLPTDHKPHYAMMIGYPKYRFLRAPKRDAVKVTWG